MDNDKTIEDTLSDKEVESILDRMVDEGLLDRQVINGEVTYSVTEKGKEEHRQRFQREPDVFN